MNRGVPPGVVLGGLVLLGALWALSTVAFWVPFVAILALGIGLSLAGQMLAIRRRRHPRPIPVELDLFDDGPPAPSGPVVIVMPPPDRPRRPEPRVIEAVEQP